MCEEPARAVITSRCDLGFIVQLPDGRWGELRVPEMSSSTADYDRSPARDAGNGCAVDVYVIRETEGGCLVSEFSAEERAARDQGNADWIHVQAGAQVGDELLVRVERKLPWGCICRQETEPYLEGVIAAPDTVAQKQLPALCAVANLDWERLTEGSILTVIIVHKQWAHWRYVLYFSRHPLPDKPNT